MSDGFDDELRGRFADAAAAIERSPLAQPGRGMRRGRVPAFAPVALVAGAVLLLAVGVPRLVAGSGRSAPIGPADGGTAIASPDDRETREPDVTMTLPRPTPARTPTPSGPPPTSAATPPGPTPAGRPTATPATSPPDRSTAPVQPCYAPPESARPPEGVSVEVEMDSTDLRPGASVQLRIRVRNDGATPATYSHGGYKVDFWALDADGALAWRWGSGRAFTTELQQKTLAPGEEHEEQLVWDGTGCGDPVHGGEPRRLPAGRYRLHGLWEADGPGTWWSRNHVPFEIH